MNLSITKGVIYISKRLKQDQYITIKTLATAKVPYDEIAKLTGFAYSTVSRVKKSTDFEDYKQARRAENERYLDKQKAKATTDDKPQKKYVADQLVAEMFDDDYRKALDEMQAKIETMAYKLGVQSELIKQINATVSRIEETTAQTSAKMKRKVLPF